MSFNIIVEGGSSVRLPTAGKYCDRDIVITATGGGSGETDPRDQYQRVEYITAAEEDTYPYVITDICADNSTGVEIVASFPVMEDRIPMGSRENSDATRFYCAYPLSTSSVYYGFNTGVNNQKGVIESCQKYT